MLKNRRRTVLVGFMTLSACLFFLPATSSESAKAAEPKGPESVELTTSDGVLLKGTYYRSQGGRNSPVAILLADQGESRAVFRTLALALQSPSKESKRASWAVLAVDLRGQGDSNRVRNEDGTMESFGSGRINSRMLTDRAEIDMEAVRSFLVDRNDGGTLNLNRCAVVGIGLNGIVATHATAFDWSQRQLNRGKQGQDIKAVVLISTSWSAKGLSVLGAIRQPGVQTDVAFMLVHGSKDKKATTDAQRIAKQLKKKRFNEPEAEKGQQPSVAVVESNTSLNGAALLKQTGRTGQERIAKFLEQYVVKPDYPWVKRRLD